MFFNKKHKARTQQAKVLELQAQREQVKKNIRLLHTDMQTLIEKASTADELDRQIYSLEYEEKKNELATETAHFNELSKLISQLNGVAMVYERQKIFNQVASVAETIDTQAVLKADDMMRAHQEVMLEESDQLDEVLKSSSMSDKLSESVEFTRLVNEAKLKKAENLRNKTEAVCALADA